MRRCVTCFVLAAAMVVALAGCKSPQVVAGWQAPPGAPEAPLSAVPGRYDFSGAGQIRVNGVPTDPATALLLEYHAAGVALGQILPAATPVAGHARIVLPDHDRLRLIAGAPNRPATPSWLDFNAELIRLSLHELADSVMRSRVFASVELAEQNDTIAPDANGADYLIWFQVRSLRPNNAGPWIGQWQMQHGAGPAMANISVDPGTPVGPPRLLSFLRSVRAAAGYGGPVVAGSVGTAGERPAGTGIVVDGQGHVLTNNHVIANCAAPRVVGNDGNDDSAELVATDATNDLALLKIARHAPIWARFRGSEGLQPGEAVIVTGFPLAGLVSPEMAVNTGSLTALAGFRGDSRQLQFSAPIQPGNSGGPLLDNDGRVIGIASAMLNGVLLAAVTGALPQNVNFAIKTDTARAFLAENHVALDTSRGRTASGAAAVGDLARRFTVKIACAR